MTENTDNAPVDPVLGAIEPHAGMLTAPPAGQQLYKIMTVEDLIRSVSGGYLYFNRVDSYKDFRNADGHDGEQLQQDRPSNETARFERAPDYAARRLPARGTTKKIQIIAITYAAGSIPVFTTKLS